MRSAYHPDYLCYINAPVRKPYLAISDSNVDWGQSLKQVKAWLDARAPERENSLPLLLRQRQWKCTVLLGNRVVMLDQ